MEVPVSVVTVVALVSVFPLVVEVVVVVSEEVVEAVVVVVGNFNSGYLYAPRNKR